MCRDKAELREQIIEYVQSTKEHKQDEEISLKNVRDGDGNIIPVVRMEEKAGFKVLLREDNRTVEDTLEIVESMLKLK